MAIIITAKKNGFRRCGVAHSDKPTIHKDDRFSAEELEVLKKEPMLIVHVENDDSKKDKKAAKEDK